MLCLYVRFLQGVLSERGCGIGSVVKVSCIALGRGSDRGSVVEVSCIALGRGSDRGSVVEVSCIALRRGSDRGSVVEVSCIVLGRGFDLRNGSICKKMGHNYYLQLSSRLFSRRSQMVAVD